MVVTITDRLLEQAKVRPLQAWGKGISRLGWCVTDWRPQRRAAACLAVCAHPVGCAALHPSASYFFFPLDALEERPQVLDALQNIGYTWVSPDRFREDEPGGDRLDCFLEGLEVCLRYDGEPPESFEALAERELEGLSACGTKGVGSFVRVTGPMPLELIE